MNRALKTLYWVTTQDFTSMVHVLRNLFSLIIDIIHDLNRKWEKLILWSYKKIYHSESILVRNFSSKLNFKIVNYLFKITGIFCFENKNWKKKCRWFNFWYSIFFLLSLPLNLDLKKIQKFPWRTFLNNRVVTFILYYVFFLFS